MCSMPELFPILPGALPAKGGADEVGNKAWNLMRMAQAGTSRARSLRSAHILVRAPRSGQWTITEAGVGQRHL